MKKYITLLITILIFFIYCEQEVNDQIGPGREYYFSFKNKTVEPHKISFYRMKRYTSENFINDDIVKTPIQLKIPIDKNGFTEYRTCSNSISFYWRFYYNGYDYKDKHNQETTRLLRLLENNINETKYLRIALSLW